MTEGKYADTRSPLVYVLVWALIGVAVVEALVIADNVAYDACKGSESGWCHFVSALGMLLTVVALTVSSFFGVQDILNAYLVIGVVGGFLFGVPAALWLFILKPNTGVREARRKAIRAILMGTLFGFAIPVVILLFDTWAYDTYGLPPTKSTFIDSYHSVVNFASSPGNRICDAINKGNSVEWSYLMNGLLGSVFGATIALLWKIFERNERKS